jgi:hypothetical protein
VVPRQRDDDAPLARRVRDDRHGLLYADLRIESSGGGEDILSHGHYKGDAERVKALVEDWQAQQLGRPAARVP